MYHINQSYRDAQCLQCTKVMKSEAGTPQLSTKYPVQCGVPPAHGVSYRRRCKFTMRWSLIFCGCWYCIKHPNNATTKYHYSTHYKTFISSPLRRLLDTSEIPQCLRIRGPCMTGKFQHDPYARTDPWKTRPSGFQRCRHGRQGPAEVRRCLDVVRAGLAPPGGGNFDHHSSRRHQENENTETRPGVLSASAHMPHDKPASAVIILIISSSSSSNIITIIIMIKIITWTLTVSSHHRHRQDKTVLSCLVRVGGVNRNGDKSRLSATENFGTVLSSLEMCWGLDSCSGNTTKVQNSRSIVTGMGTGCNMRGIAMVTETGKERFPWKQ